VVYGDVWERPGLSKRDRSLITCAALVAMNRSEQLRATSRAPSTMRDQGRDRRVITHMAFYSGWPTAMTAAASPRKCSKGDKK